MGIGLLGAIVLIVVGYFALRPSPTVVQVEGLYGPDTLLVATEGFFSAFVEQADSSTHYSWDFGDGTRDTGASNQLATHFYKNAGTYTVTFVASNASSSDTRSMTLVVVLPLVCNPVVSLEISMLSKRVTPNRISFAAFAGGTVPMNFMWDFGDGTTSTESNPFHVYEKRSTYTVTLEVSNCGGTESVRQTIDLVNLTIN